MMRDPLNRIIMEDIGLTVDPNNKIMDQDTRQELKYKDKSMRYSSQNSVVLTQADMAFDPASNKSLMNNLFDHYLTKIEDEDGTYVPIYYEERNPDGQGTGLIAKIHREGSATEEVLKTQYYNNDSLKYVEMIRQINESSNTNLSEYDSEPKDMTKPQRKRKKKKVIDFR